jgi:hypothetical protein
MPISRVWILFEPRIYSDLFARLLKCTGMIEVLDWKSSSDLHSGAQNGGPGPVDVIILSLDAQGEPELAGLPQPPVEAKLLAFSPKGDYGWRRLPGEKTWEEVRPFGLDQMMREVQFGRQRPTDSAGLLDQWLSNNHRLKAQLRRKAQSNQDIEQQNL